VLVVGFTMPPAAVGLALDEGWAKARQSTFPCLDERSVNRRSIIAVDHLARHGIGHGPVGNVLYPGVLLEALGPGVDIVLTHKYHRQRPKAGQVQGLVKGALIGRAVSEETDRDTGFLPILLSESDAHGDGKASPHHGCRAQRIDLGNRQVQRAAFALVAPRPLAVNLRHQRPGVRPFGK